jgi:hypothetical protein
MKNILQAYWPSYLWFSPPLILGGSVISAGTIHDLRRVKVPGTGPLWNPWFLQSLRELLLFIAAVYTGTYRVWENYYYLLLQSILYVQSLRELLLFVAAVYTGTYRVWENYYYVLLQSILVRTEFERTIIICCCSLYWYVIMS